MMMKFTLLLLTLYLGTSPVFDKPTITGRFLILRKIPSVHFTGPSSKIASGSQSCIVSGIVPFDVAIAQFELLLTLASEADKPILSPPFLLKRTGGINQQFLQHSSHLILRGDVNPTTSDELGLVPPQISFAESDTGTTSTLACAQRLDRESPKGPLLYPNFAPETQ